ncbi:BrnT family toxin [Aureimonas glaciei]|uniref:BrnT family toxin n=1 Tax=Aureimonas glaciei TaxID=1776957 RepID=UPI001FCE7145|nr:BrnT family toxin [Aureimonas glaciei]
MKISFDPAKHERALRERGLDFRRAAEVFKSTHTSAPDDRFDYGESRMISAGYLDGRMVVIVWTLGEENPAHHFDEVLSCQGRKALAKTPGLIPTTRPN